MSQYISGLLGATEPDFTMLIQSLEKHGHKAGTDIQLTLDIKNSHKSKLRELGLDPEDTTSEELYQSLMSLARRHDAFLQKSIGGVGVQEANELLPLIRKRALELGVPKVWALKHSAAKRLLKKTPPKQLMKALGYRSLDSLLKRENICEVYAALRFVETPAWLKRFIQSYKSLQPSDFEIRPIEITILQKQKWQKLADNYVRKSHHNIVPVKEMGAIILLPLPVKKIAGLTLVSLPLLLHYVNELRLYSAFFKFNQVKTDFGSLLVRTLLEDPPAAVKLGPHPVHWRIVHSHFGKRTEIPEEVFEPHVHAEDLQWQRAEDVLFKLEPALMFWKDIDYVGSLTDDGFPVSLNLLDVAASYYNGLPLPRQSLLNLRASLCDELFRRYLALPKFEDQALAQLDSGQGMVDWKHI
jgi:hypothetical protein